MNRLAAGLAASALATSGAVFACTGTAMAASPTCRAAADAPRHNGGYIAGVGWIHCSQLATFTLTTKLWRNNSNGTYTSWTNASSDVETDEGLSSNAACTSGGARQWHTEAIISWKIYNGSSLEASGSSYDNSSDVNIACP